MNIPYKDMTLGVDERAENLLTQMTLEEKVAQIGGIWSSDVTDESKQHFDRDKALRVVPHGIGHISRIGAVSLLPPQQSAK
ncbi:MAG: beta-glucosidase, partial [Anaerolineae bacterium]|nr:beta-glucosidase [Anaerolineae bacterium]